MSFGNTSWFFGEFWFGLTLWISFCWIDVSSNYLTSCWDGSNFVFQYAAEFSRVCLKIGHPWRYLVLMLQEAHFLPALHLSQTCFTAYDQHLTQLLWCQLFWQPLLWIPEKSTCCKLWSRIIMKVSLSLHRYTVAILGISLLTV